MQTQINIEHEGRPATIIKTFKNEAEGNKYIKALKSKGVKVVDVEKV